MQSNYCVDNSTQMRVLTDDQCQQILGAAMEILERTGALYHNQKAVDILKKGGCDIDDKLVKIPSRMVERSLRQAPMQITLHDSRTGERRLVLEGDNSYFGCGSDTPFAIDPYSGERKQATKKSVADACRVMDGLPNIDFIMSLGIVQDVSQPIYDRHQVEAQILNTSKPIITTATDKVGYSDIIEMCEVVAGGEDELRRHPFMTLYAEPISPLVHNEEAADKLMVAAEKSLPVVYTPCVMAGATVPATMAGVLAQGLAESLSGLVLNQLTRPEAPFIMGGVFTIMDMQTTIFSYGAPEFDLLMAGLADLSRYLDLPMFGTAGCTDSKVVDEQACIEGALSCLLSAQGGANLIHDVGYIEHGNTSSLEYLVVNDEIIGMARHIVNGMEVNEKTLALDLIDKVGPGGHFLGEEHTMETLKTETFFPDLMDRQRYENWEKDGKKRLEERANEKAIDILETHEVDPLPKETIKNVKAIVERAESSL